MRNYFTQSLYVQQMNIAYDEIYMESTITNIWINYILVFKLYHN